MHDNPAAGITRRHFFRDCGYGVGKIALASLLTGAVPGRVPAAQGPARNPLAPRRPHFTARARAVIHLFMAGAPSQLELFDYKPRLAALEGRPIPPEVIGGQRYAFIRPDAATLGPRFRFARHGQSGAELSETLPHLARVADDLCIVRSLHTDQFNHGPAQIFLNTGFAVPGRPSLGSWVVYGLGAETEDLPAFVVMSTGSGISGGAGHQGQRLLAHDLQGGAPADLRRADPQRLQPRRLRPGPAARDAGPGHAPEPAAAGRGGRPGDRHAHSRLRDGVPPASVGPRA